MKLQQLRFLAEVERSQLNISAAARHLHTSQPGISKQIKLLEEELGIPLFVRSGRHLTHMTAAGRHVIARAHTVLQEIKNVRAIAAEFKDEGRGVLTIATTHLHARYALPRIVPEFRRRYPRVTLRICQGTPARNIDLALKGEAEFVIVGDGVERPKAMMMLPCYRWEQALVAPVGHPLAAAARPALEEIAEQPIVAYEEGFASRAALDRAFDAARLTPRIVLVATDADLLKTYVRLGQGIGVMARMNCEAGRDDDLVAVAAPHLFPDGVASIGCRRGTFLRGYMYAFLELLAPHLDRQRVDAAAHAPAQRVVDFLFEDIRLPLYDAQGLVATR